MSRILRLVLVLLVLLVAGAASFMGLTQTFGIADRIWADMAPEMLLLLLSPGLLIPYSILTWLRSGRVLPGLLSAAVCSVCYSFLFFLIIPLQMILALGPQFTVIVAFVPGIGLAFAGTYFAQGLKAGKKKVEVEEAPPTQQ